MKATLVLFLTKEDPSMEYIRHAFNRLAFFQDRVASTVEQDNGKRRLVLAEDGSSFFPEDPLAVAQLLMARAKAARDYVAANTLDEPRRMELLAAAENAAQASLQLTEWWAQVGAPVARAQAACQRVELPPPSTDPR